MNTFFCHFSLSLSVFLSVDIFQIPLLPRSLCGKKSRACPLNFPSDSNYCRRGEGEEEESNDSSRVGRTEFGWRNTRRRSGGVAGG